MKSFQPEIEANTQCKSVVYNYDGFFQSEIEPNVPFMSKKLMLTFVNMFRKIDRSVVMVMQ